MVLVVVLFPVGDDGAGFVNMVEGVHVQALVTHATVEGFNVPVTPWLTWWNVMDSEFFLRELTFCKAEWLVAPVHLQYSGARIVLRLQQEPNP